MIELRTLRENPDVARASQRARGEDETLVDALLSADERRRAAVARGDALRAEQRQFGKRVGAAKGDDRAVLIAKGKELASEVKAAEAEQAAAEAELTEAQMRMSNIVEPDTPPGGEDDFVVLKHVGTPPTFDFTPRDHVELGELLGAIDTERGAKVSGARFYFLTGVGAQLQLALLNMAIAQAAEAGFIPVITPTLVRPEIMAGTGFLGAHDAEVYRLRDDDLYLVGTSEVALAGFHSDEILDLSAGPRRYAGWSSCFRREAGSYGKDTRGIIRVHQFDKVEMFSYVPLAEAEAEHERLLEQEKGFLTDLELPFRTIDVAAGDLGSSASRKFDNEAWLPSQQRWLELTSTSNCTDFQARRLGIRHRVDGSPQVAATLNGTMCAIGRTIAVLLEVHQRADGSVHVPVALRPFLGGTAELTPA